MTATWVMAVAGIGDGSTAMLAMQPDDRDQHKQVAIRLRRAAFARIGRYSFERGAWPLSASSAVDVVHRRVVRVTTGQASLYAAGPLEATPMWLSAARERRALVALVPPGTFDPDAAVPSADDGLAALSALAAGNGLLGALAVVRFDVFTPGPGAPTR